MDSVEADREVAGGGEVDSVDAGEGEVVTETGSSGKSAGNRKDKETEGEEDTLE